MPDKVKAVLYCDAGLSGVGQGSIVGYGIHGYTYIEEAPKTGTGNKDAVPTSKGYNGPLDTHGTKIEEDPVTVINYIDVIGSARNHESSSHAELASFIEALKWLVTRDDIEDVLVYCDNLFVVDSVNKYLSNWIRGNWKRSNGEDVKHKDLWLEFLKLKESIDAKMAFEIKWIKGHNGNIGNETADQLATKGKALSRNEKDGDVLTYVSDAKGYWNPKVELPRLLQAPRYYFETCVSDSKDTDGFTIYNCGSHGPKDKETELLGKPYSDNYLGVIKTREPNEVLEQFRGYSASVPTSASNRIVVVHLDQVLSSKTYAELSKHGLRFCPKSDKQILIKDYTNKVLASEMHPIGQGYRMANIWTILLKHLNNVHSNSDLYQITDITDQLYETQGAKNKQVLSSKWTQRVKHFDVKVPVNLSTKHHKVPTIEKKVRILFGQDILSRNQLAALAGTIKKVCVVTWYESDQVARYATYIETVDGDHGLWARYEANLILCTDK